jgi:hypothetical protein
MPMPEDQERWAEALASERLHGERAKAWVTERIAVFREARDSKGVERFDIIAARLEQLQFGRARGH